MKTGTVKFFNEEKGYGFIKADDSQEDIFVHQTGIRDDIRKEDRVEFSVEQGQKGLSAVNVRTI